MSRSFSKTLPEIRYAQRIHAYFFLSFTFFKTNFLQFRNGWTWLLNINKYSTRFIHATRNSNYWIVFGFCIKIDFREIQQINAKKEIKRITLVIPNFSVQWSVYIFRRKVRPLPIFIKQRRYREINANISMILLHICRFYVIFDQFLTFLLFSHHDVAKI